MNDAKVKPTEWDREFAIMVEKFYADFGPEIVAITGTADALMDGGHLAIEGESLTVLPPEGEER